jgi:hypothetical protein
VTSAEKAVLYKAAQKYHRGYVYILYMYL